MTTEITETRKIQRFLRAQVACRETEAKRDHARTDFIDAVVAVERAQEELELACTALSIKPPRPIERLFAVEG